MNNTILEETKFLMKKYHITANKNLGQNFLISDETVENIVASAEITKQDLVLEIGPGLGTLTSSLLEKAGKVIAVELDDRMIKILNDRFSLYNNFKLINEDILKIDLKQLLEENLKDLTSVKIVANLPYYITTPIIMKLLEDNLGNMVQSITVMVQKEVADRITAVPGDRLAGAITYSVYYYAEARPVVFVPKECFLPAPEIDSEVIKLDIRKEPPVEVDNEEMLFKIIKASFMQRRKTLLNGLVNSGVVSNKEEGKKLLEKSGIPINQRGEKLSIEEFAKITNNLT